MERMIAILLILSAAICGCLDNPRDNPYDHWIVPDPPVDPPAADTVPPVPGDSGKLNLIIVDPTTVSLNWVKANDSFTLQEDLEYKVAYSESDNISTPDGVEDYGTISQDWTKDLGGKTIVSLSKGKTYYFNVSVRDAKGNRAVYSGADADILNVVYMFSTGTHYNGNLGGRSGADAKCQACYDAYYSSLSCTSVRAFVSFDSGDSIANMPGKYSIPDNLVIHGPTGKRIGKNWADILDGSIEITLADAEVESSRNYWTGSNSDGGYNEQSCSGWTTDVFEIFHWNYGIGGSFDKTVAAWLTLTGDGGSCVGCDNELPILCVGW